MKRTFLIICSIALCAILALIFVCNTIVTSISAGMCFDDINTIPHKTYGLLLGTGRGSAPSPYYDARLQATIDLYNAGKVDSVIISGENLYDDYFEVDSMVLAMSTAGVPICLIDTYGTDTYTSLRRMHAFDKYKNGNITIISQHFHNQRAQYYGIRFYGSPLIAYDATDTDIWYWNIWRITRESLARTKAVLFSLFVR